MEAPVWAMRGCSHYTIGHSGCLVILSLVIASLGRFTLSQQDSVEELLRCSRVTQREPSE